jgi:hypothetical protein
MTTKYKPGDLLVDTTDGDILEYLGKGFVKWVTFSGRTDHQYVDQVIRLKEIHHNTALRKMTKLERELK